MLRNLLLVGAGGFLGSILRYAVGIVVKSIHFPFATFIVNIIGCFVIGVVYGLSIKSAAFPMETRLFLATGICGGFTTFSAFSVEGVQMLQQDRFMVFFLYFAASVLIGLLATWLGIKTVTGS